MSEQTIAQLAQQLWDIAYEVAHQSISSANTALFASQGQQNDMQRALINHLAALKQTTDAAKIQSLADQVQADFLGLEVVGYISADTMQHVNDIIAQIKE